MKIAKPDARVQAIWTCERGRLRAKILIAPTVPPSLQTVDWDKMN